MSDTPDQITSIDQIKTMTADEIEAARVSGRIDFRALHAERDAAQSAATKRTRQIRDGIRSGALPIDLARHEQLHRERIARNDPNGVPE